MVVLRRLSWAGHDHLSRLWWFRLRLKYDGDPETAASPVRCNFPMPPDSLTTNDPASPYAANTGSLSSGAKPWRRRSAPTERTADRLSLSPRGRRPHTPAYHNRDRSGSC